MAGVGGMPPLAGFEFPVSPPKKFAADFKVSFCAGAIPALLAHSLLNAYCPLRIMWVMIHLPTIAVVPKPTRCAVCKRPLPRARRLGRKRRYWAVELTLLSFTLARLVFGCAFARCACINHLSVFAEQALN
jgi:hypothetical protein